MDHKDKVSLRDATNEFNCVHSAVHQTLKSKTKTFARKKVPVYKENQEQMVQKQCQSLTRLFDGETIIPHDKAYFSVNKCIRKSSYLSNVADTSPTVKFKGVEKYPLKVLVWNTGSEKGLSTLYVIKKSSALNPETYIKECLNKRVILYLEETHGDDDTIFWPDKASYHDANITVDFMLTTGVPFVPKE